MDETRKTWVIEWVVPADSTLRGVGIYGDTRVLAADMMEARRTFDSLLDVDFFYPAAGVSASDPDVLSGSYRWADDIRNAEQDEFDADAVLKESWEVLLMGVGEVRS